jgi:hypothetical protein
VTDVADTRGPSSQENHSANLVNRNDNDMV